MTAGRIAMLDAALFYASQGVEVFPLAGKSPRTRRGFHDATTHPDFIRGWWLTTTLNVNIGLRVPEGIVVIDVDPRNGGDESLTRLETQFGPLPDTLTCLTGGGGRHLWLAYNGAARGRLATGIDVKTHKSGYVVAPPSIHPDTGRRYEWLNHTTPTAAAPPWLRHLLDPPRMVAPKTLANTNIDRLVAFVADGTEGERNRRLYWACCRAAENGHDPEDLIAVSGLPDAEARRTANSATRKVTGP